MGWVAICGFILLNVVCLRALTAGKKLISH